MPRQRLGVRSILGVIRWAMSARVRVCVRVCMCACARTVAVLELVNGRRVLVLVPQRRRFGHDHGSERRTQPTGSHRLRQRGGEKHSGQHKEHHRRHGHQDLGWQAEAAVRLFMLMGMHRRRWRVGGGVSVVEHAASVHHCMTWAVP